MDVKARIKELLKERGWTLSRLAKETGISVHAVYNWYNDNNFTPSRDAIEDICAAFGITLAQFYSDIEADKLSEKELRLLELFRQIPDSRKESLLTVAKTLIE